jgi:hypothetical protein
MTIVNQVEMTMDEFISLRKEAILEYMQKDDNITPEDAAEEMSGSRLLKWIATKYNVEGVLVYPGSKSPFVELTYKV